MSVRVRYAPSPTGLQHIGSVRTALFNYFFAKSNGGSCILRIEDTDQSRFDSRSLADIFETFAWLGIRFDEGGDRDKPILQSERRALYAEQALWLVNEGFAYRCFCSPDRLSALRAEQKAAGRAQGYDRRCRSLSREESERRAKTGEPFVIRFRVPGFENDSGNDLGNDSDGEPIRVVDEVLGEIHWTELPVDPVLLKSDGLPTYHLACVVDDHCMDISHVIRAQEWLSSLPLHCLLYDAFAWPRPQFFHLPMVLGSDGKKLSKRHGATSIGDFKSEGYLPEAIINYVSMLGWSHSEPQGELGSQSESRLQNESGLQGNSESRLHSESGQQSQSSKELSSDREFFTVSELEEQFAKGSIHKAPAVFDYQKLQWYNAHYIKKTSTERLATLTRPYIAPFIDANSSLEREPENEQIFKTALPLAQERMKVLSELPNIIGFLFADPDIQDARELQQKNQTTEVLMNILGAVQGNFEELYQQAEGGNSEAFLLWFKNLSQELNCGLGKVMMPIRIAVTGSKQSPPLADSIRLLGKAKSLKRIESALRLIHRTK